MMKMEVAPPKVLKQPLVIPQRVLMGPGPSNVHPRVLHAMSHNVLGHMNQETFQIMDEIKEGIRYLFQTKNDLTLATSATGHSGMEAILCNLIEPGDKVLVAVNGLWGTRAADMAERYGGVVTEMTVKLGKNFTFDVIESFLSKVRPKLLFIVQGETSTGVFQPIEGLGKICHRYDCLLAVDLVATVGGVPFFMDKWEVDAAYTAVQKILSVPTGLAIMSFSPKAQKVIFDRKIPPKVFFWDMRILGQQWKCYDKPRIYHHTVSSSLLSALRESLAMLAEEGLENVIKRHEICYERLAKGLQDLGLKFFVEEEKDRLITVTSLIVRDEFDHKEFLDFCMKKYSLEIGTGLLGQTGGGKLLRVGLMGYNATLETVEFTLKVMKEAKDHAETKSSSKL
ncbi:unnamed protein product [Phaedon cochleariae]|uniref:Alanine--glyoxylate aminotransferase n=1 Tax=Phaedon cochleariae TaxID=80249 RepID=A0A9P0DMU2_PHACE|nr:unnamed protein product [Phaedon cochleariae]